jgi:hypothetical protein
MRTLMQAHLAILAHVGAPWYNNAWFIGIATGLASGAIIAVITPLFLRRRRARDLAIRRDRAADDTLSTLRPAVASGTLPSCGIVEAIARASAFRRGLDPKLATSTAQLVDELISEIMISPFLAPDTRLQLANKLLSLRAELEKQPEPRPVQEGRGTYRSTTIITSVLGALLCGAAAAGAVYTKSWVPFVAAGALALVSYVTTQILNRLTSRLSRLSLGTGPIEFEFAEPSLSISEIVQRLQSTENAGKTESDRVSEDPATGNGAGSSSAKLMTPPPSDSGS